MLDAALLCAVVLSGGAQADRWGVDVRRSRSCVGLSACGMDMLVGPADGVRVESLPVATIGSLKLPDAVIAGNGDQCAKLLRRHVIGEKLNMAIRQGRVESTRVSEFVVVSEIQHHFFTGILRSHPVDGMFMSHFDQHQCFCGAVSHLGERSGCGGMKAGVCANIAKVTGEAWRQRRAGAAIDVRNGLECLRICRIIPWFCKVDRFEEILLFDKWQDQL